RVVKAFGQEAHETARFVHRSRGGMTERLRMALLEGGYGLLIGLVTALGVAAVLLIGVGHVRAGVITLGQLLLVLGYLGQLYEPLKTISRKATALQGYLASAERAFALLDEQPDVPERPHARPVTRATGAVEFRGVSFAYGPDRPVLHDISFKIEPGTRLGVVGASTDQIVAAAHAANAHEFIVRLPRGYDTQVGERGAQLSGGQRQRIALARAFLKDSPVVILDEPTSAVDAETEARILGAMRHLMRGRTVLVISHRPSTLERCAGLLVLDSGRVVSDTTPSVPSAQPPVAQSAAGERRSNLKTHPAVRAWCELYPHAEPVSITPLRVRKRKSNVYRLEGVGQAGSAVIAKRCRTAV